jgi:hypothetical protein
MIVPDKPQRFYRQKSFYGGIAIGIVLLPLLILLITWIGAPHGQAAAPPAVTSGDMTITMDDNLLTTGMRLALQREQSKLPFTISHVSAATQKGDHVELDADGPSLLGSAPISMMVAMAPRITSQGQLDFQITDVQVAGIDVSFFGLTNAALESALNDQFSDMGQGNLVKGLDYQLLDVRTDNGAMIITAKLYQPGVTS